MEFFREFVVVVLGSCNESISCAGSMFVVVCGCLISSIYSCIDMGSTDFGGLYCSNEPVPFVCVASSSKVAAVGDNAPVFPVPVIGGSSSVSCE